MLRPPLKIALLASILSVLDSQAAQFVNATATTNLAWPNDGSRWRAETMMTSWVDYDGDGFLDLFVSPHAFLNDGKQEFTLFRNLGNGKFGAPLLPFPKPEEADSHETMWADFDNDGDQDLFVQFGGKSGAAPETTRAFYRNDAGVFKNIAIESGLSPVPGSGRGCLFFDWDKNGKLDLCLFNANTDDSGLFSQLLQQTPTGFVDKSGFAGFEVQGAANFGLVSDIFGDGIPDLLVLSGQKNERELGFVARVYQNATTSLVDRSGELPLELSAPNGRDMVVADFNGDLIPDFLIVSTPITFDKASTISALPEWVRNSIQPPTYVASSPSGYVFKSPTAGFTQGYYGMSVAAGDFDNDGDLDVYMTGQVGQIGVQAKYFRNNGHGFFTEVAGANGATFAINGPIQRYDQECGQAFSVGDFDNDGFLDIFLAPEVSPFKTPTVPTINIPATLFRNTRNANHWLEINLVGTVSNRDAIGTKVTLSAGGKQQLREQTGMMRRNAQDMKRIHFGLGTATLIGTLTVNWPSGKTTILNNVAPDRIITITEPTTP